MRRTDVLNLRFRAVLQSKSCQLSTIRRSIRAHRRSLSARDPLLPYQDSISAINLIEFSNKLSIARMKHQVCCRSDVAYLEKFQPRLTPMRLMSQRSEANLNSDRTSSVGDDLSKYMSLPMPVRTGRVRT